MFENLWQTYCIKINAIFFLFYELQLHLLFKVIILIVKMYF